MKISPQSRFSTELPTAWQHDAGASARCWSNRLSYMLEPGSSPKPLGKQLRRLFHVERCRILASAEHGSSRSPRTVSRVHGVLPRTATPAQWL